MKRALSIIALGLVCGFSSYWGYLWENKPGGAVTLESQIEWMGRELNLSHDQIEKITRLHFASKDRLATLSSEVSKLRREYEAFEETRRTSDSVDFLEFANFVDQQRAMTEECKRSTKNIVLASAKEMNPKQREHYLKLVAPVALLTVH